jgi:hypothetical protein
MDQIMYNYESILNWKYGHCDFTMSNPLDYDTLVWNDTDVSKPTREFLERKLDLLSQSDIVSCRFKRSQEYPSIGDQLDALFKAGLFPPEMAAQIQAVKDKYPKQGDVNV